MGLILSCLSRKPRRGGGGGYSPSPSSPAWTEKQNAWSYRRHQLKQGGRRRIYFYDRDRPYYGFTNFSPHPILFDNKLYPTSEHLFQSLKFLGYRPELAERIRTCSDRPSMALEEARRFSRDVRPDWKNVNIKMMEVALRHKFAQHKDLKNMLLSTGDAELIEDSPIDDFWGVGRDRKGRNELGKALERLRGQLRHEAQAVSYAGSASISSPPSYGRPRR